MKNVLTILSLIFSLYSFESKAKDLDVEKHTILIANENLEDNSLISGKIEALQNQIDSLNVLVSAKTGKKWPGRPKKASTCEEDTAKGTFIADRQIIRKLKFIALVEDCLLKDVIDEAFKTYIIVPIVDLF